MSTSAKQDYDKIAALYDLARIGLTPYIAFGSGLLRAEAGPDASHADVARVFCKPYQMLTMALPR